MEDKLKDLRKLLDERVWPKDYIIVQGELYSFVPSGDPGEECVKPTLSNGRFQ